MPKKKKQTWELVYASHENPDPYVLGEFDSEQEAGDYMCELLLDCLDLDHVCNHWIRVKPKS